MIKHVGCYWSQLNLIALELQNFTLYLNHEYAQSKHFLVHATAGCQGKLGSLLTDQTSRGAVWRWKSTHSRRNATLIDKYTGKWVLRRCRKILCFCFMLLLPSFISESAAADFHSPRHIQCSCPPCNSGSRIHQLTLVWSIPSATLGNGGNASLRSSRTRRKDF